MATKKEGVEEKEKTRVAVSLDYNKESQTSIDGLLGQEEDTPRISHCYHLVN